MRGIVQQLPYLKYLTLPASRVIHVGMHEGEELKAYAEELCASQIYSFEPNPLKQQAILEKISGVQSDTCKIYHSNYALSSSPGVSKLNTFMGFSSGFSSFLEPNMEAMKQHFFADPRHHMANGGGLDRQIVTFNVAVTTLDQFMGEHCKTENLAIDLIVLDVQGFELEVLKGSFVTLANTNALYIELTSDPNNGIYNSMPSADSIFKFLRRQGFKPVPETFRPYGVSGHGNMLFLK